MSQLIEITPALVGAAVSFLGVLLAYLGKRVSELKSEEFQSVLKETRDSVLRETRSSTGINIGGMRLQKEVRTYEPDEALTEHLISQVESGIIEKMEDLDGLNKDQVRGEVEKRVTEIRERLEKIETRFPDASSIDKISSINDALFAERIDQLEKRLEGIESSLLSKWDVATIVSVVLSGIFMVVGATYGALKAFGVVT